MHGSFFAYQLSATSDVGGALRFSLLAASSDSPAVATVAEAAAV